MIMNHADWMKHTYGGITSTRSDTLKAVDTALANYHAATFTSERERMLRALRTALMAWIAAKGPGWKTSARNRTNAIDTLHKQVMGFPAPARSGAAAAAVSTLEAEGRALLDKLFKDKELEYRQGFAWILAGEKRTAKLAAGGIVHNSHKLAAPPPPPGRPGAPPPPPPRPGRPAAPPPPPAPGIPGQARAKADELIRTIVPQEIMADVMLQLTNIIPNFVTELVAAITPFVGVISSGAGAAWGAKNMIRDEYRRSQAEMHLARSMSKETPEKAIQSIIRIIEREFANSGIETAISTTEFASKLAGALADGGTATTVAIGLAANIAKLTNIIRNVVRDVQEKNVANKLMKQSIDLSIFEACPIVGAYYVCCAPHSVLVNGLLKHLGDHGFNDQVERTLSHHIEPLREQARRLIRAHRFVIPSLQSYPGVLTENSNALERMAERTGKTGMTGISSAEMAEWNAVETRTRR